MRFKYQIYATAAFVFSVIMSQPAFSSSTLFPPENTSECNANTALTWDGNNNVRCSKVIMPSNALGDPVVVKTVSHWGTGFAAAYNNDIKAGATSFFGSYTTDAEIWYSMCSLANDSDVTQYDNIITNYGGGCLKMACEGQMGRQSGTAGWPRLAQWSGGCAQGANTTCATNYGIAMDCFNTLTASSQ